MFSRQTDMMFFQIKLFTKLHTLTCLGWITTSLSRRRMGRDQDGFYHGSRKPSFPSNETRWKNSLTTLSSRLWRESSTMKQEWEKRRSRINSSSRESSRLRLYLQWNQELVCRGAKYRMQKQRLSPGPGTHKDPRFFSEVPEVLDLPLHRRVR